MKNRLERGLLNIVKHAKTSCVSHILRNNKYELAQILVIITGTFEGERSDNGWTYI